MKKCINYNCVGTIICFTIIILFPFRVWAQEGQLSNYDRDTLIMAAKEIMSAAHYCALITLDESGHPQVRTMDPFTPEKNMVVWLGTNSNSRKVKEIRNDTRTTLYYQDPDGAGYVVIKGHAYLVDDKEKKIRYWKKEWERFYSGLNNSYILIRIVPDKIEIVDYKYGIINDPKTWDVPYIEFKSN